jgi:transposase
MRRLHSPKLAHRQAINGILWVLRAGTSWRTLPEPYGKRTTVASRQAKRTIPEAEALGCGRGGFTTKVHV